MRSLRPPSARSRRPVGPLYGAGAPPPDPSSRGGEALREPGGGPPAGDRAPARGVDVKPSPGTGSRRVPRGLGGPERGSGGPRTPDRGPRGLGGLPEPGCPETTVPRWGVLHQPLAPGPCASGQGSDQGSPEPEKALFPRPGGVPPRKGLFGPFWSPASDPGKAGTGPRREGLM